MKKSNSIPNVFLPNKSLLRHVLPLLVLILSVNGLMAQSQQVVGSFPIMDGGMEGQTVGTLATGASVATGVAKTVWTPATSSFGTATITSATGATGARSGSKYINCAYTSIASGSGNHKRLMTPTTASGAVPVSTAYRFKFYYRLVTGAPTNGGVRGGASFDGTSGVNYGTVSAAITSTSWTKYAGGASTSAGTAALGSGIIDAYVLSGSNAALKYDYDDFVMYAASADDVTPPANPGSVTVDNNLAAQQRVNWAASSDVDGGGYVVLRFASTPDADQIPNADGIYAVNNTITNGVNGVTNPGKVVYIGTALTFNDSGLDPSTPYYYKVFSVDKAFNYCTTPSSGSGTTTAPSYDAEPTSQASGVSIASMNATGTGFTINWSAGNGTSHVVLVKAGSDVDSNPADGNTYTANTVLGSGSQIGSGNYVVFSGTGTTVDVTGLTKGTVYYVKVYTFNGTGGSENYLISSSASGNKMTLGTITSNGTGGGTWATLASWSGTAVPGQYDDVIITGSDVINVGANAKCNNITINSGTKVWATAAFTLAVYGTSLACEGTLGDISPTSSYLTIQFANNLSISGTGSIYPYKIVPVSSVSNIGVTFNANTTITYGTVGLSFENSANDNVTYTVSAEKTVNVLGSASTTGSQTAVGTGNETFIVNGTLNVGNTFNTTVASGKTYTLTVNSGGLLSTGTVNNAKNFYLAPAHAVQAATAITVNSGGEIRVNGVLDCSSPSYISTITGGGTFTTTSGATLMISNTSGLDATTGPIRTGTRTIDAGTNIQFVGTSAQVTGSDMPATINNLNVPAVGLTLSKSLTVNGNLNTTSSGVLTVGANTFSLKGTNSGSSIDGANGTIVYIGDGAQGVYTLTNVNNLTVNNLSGQTTLNFPVTVNGTLTLIAGNINNSTNNITLANGATLVRTAGTFTTAPIFGTTVNVTYNGASSITTGNELPTSAGVLNNLTINNTAGVSLAADATAANTTINASGILNVNTGKKLTLSSSLTNSGTANINGSIQLEQGSSISGNDFVYGSAGTLIFNNSSMVYLWGTPVFWPAASGPINVTVQNTGGIELQVARTVTGVFETSNVVQNNGPGKDLYVSGTVRLNTGGYFNGFSPTYTGSGTLEYNTGGTYGSSNEWISGSSVGYGVPQNVTVTNATSVDLSGARTIPGTLTLTSGTLNNSSNGLTLGDGATVVTSAGTLSAVPNFGTSVNLTYNATSVKGNEFPAANIINSLTANNTAGISLADNRAIPTLSIGSGSSVSVAAAKQLTVSSALTNNSGTLNLLSDATGTATIITPETLGGTGGIYSVSQHLTSGAIGTSGRNWYISSPVAAAAIGTITTGNASSATGNDLVSYNVGTGLWDVASGTMEVMKGYIAKSPAGNPTITFSGGELNTGAKSVSDLPVGFNLVGNPYPSYVSWDGATKTGLSTSIWYRSKRTNVYKFQTYNSAGGLGTLTGTNLIPPMQAFWVKATAGTNTVGFTNLNRSHQNQSVDSIRLKAPAIAQQVLRLEVSNAVNTDEAIVLFNPNALDAIDDYDSPKMTNNNVDIPEIYTLAGSEQLVINGLNSVAANKELALGFKAGTSNTFTIKATQVSNFDADTKIYLRDNLLNSEQELTNGASYSFSSDVTNTTTRFSVIFKSTAIATGIGNYNYDDSTLKIFKNENNQITIQRNFSENATVTVCNAIGQKLISTQMTGTSKVIDKQFSAGVYFVTVSNDGNKVTKKVIIK